MKRSLCAAGTAVLLTFLLVPALGTDWVELGPKLNATVNPQRVSQPAPVVIGNFVTAGPATSYKGGSPTLGGYPLEYVYIEQYCYCISSFPWNGSTSEVRLQTLYTKNDIGRPGTIHQMAVFQDYFGYIYHGTFPNVSIKLCNTTVTGLGSSMSGNYGGTTPVTVWHAGSHTTGIDGDSSYRAWDTIDFDTDFSYDSSKSLLIEVTWQGSASGQTYSMWGPKGGSYSPRMAYYYGSDTTCDSAYIDDYHQLNTRIGFLPPPNNVGVSKILEPHDPLSAYGDTVFTVCEVRNYGSAAQTQVPVRCKINEKVSGTVVFNEVQTVDLAVGATDTVYFSGFPPPAVEMAYIDTCRTELVGDVKPENDVMCDEFRVTLYGSLCKAYHNGSFDNATSWVNHGWWATKYATPSGAQINGMNYWVSSYGGADYSQACQLYLNDAGGPPGTLLFTQDVEMHTAVWTNMYTNHFDIEPQDGITTDSFFMAMDEKEWSNGGNYCYLGMCHVNPVGGVDYGKYGSGSWGKYTYDGDMNFGMDYCFSSPLIDVACVNVSYPPAIIDSNTTFNATFEVKNVGLHTRNHVPYQFHIVNDATNDTLLQVSGDAGMVLPGQVKSYTVPTSLTPLPGHYTMTAITNVQYDLLNQNDTFAAPLFVRYYDVKTQILSPRIQEVPGLVPVAIRLTNNGNVPAMVPRLDVTISGSTPYADNRQNIAIPVGASTVVTLNPWVCPWGTEQTTMAWITDPSDMNPGTPNDGVWNDTAQSTVRAGVPGWTEMTAMPAPPSGKYIKDGGCMAYDAGTDRIYASKGNKTGDFYTYNVGDGTWATKTNIPLGSEGKGPYKGSVICSDGNGNLYLTKGNNTVGFWGYEESPTAAGTWKQLTNVPTGSSGKKVKQGAGLAWATKGGVGAVYLLKGYRNEFHRYNPVTNAWEVLLAAPIGTANHVKWDAGSWLVADADNGNMLYAFKAKYHEFYVYDCETGTWSAAKSPMPIPGSAGNKKAKDGSCAAWYGGKIYAFKGGNTLEFWRYDPVGDSWHTQVGYDIPLYGTGGTRKKVKAGAALAGYPGIGVFATKGNKSNEFWRFTPYDVVGAQPSRDGVTGNSTQIGSLSFAIAPNPLSGGFATVRYSLPKAGLATLNVFDVTGRTVYEQTLAAGRSGTASLDLRKLGVGVYLVKVTTEGFSTTQKLVVEH
jgi:hypothetical protein